MQSLLWINRKFDDEVYKLIWQNLDYYGYILVWVTLRLCCSTLPPRENLFWQCSHWFVVWVDSHFLIEIKNFFLLSHNSKSFLKTSSLYGCINFHIQSSYMEWKQSRGSEYRKYFSLVELARTSHYVTMFYDIMHIVVYIFYYTDRPQHMTNVSLSISLRDKSGWLFWKSQIHTTIL